MHRDGGSVQGIIAGLNRILDLTVPRHEQEGGTYVIPGHGQLCDESEVLEYRDMVVIIKERIEDMVKRGMTVEQVKAAKPTLDYDLHYGADTGPWTTAMFIEAVYRRRQQSDEQRLPPRHRRALRRQRGRNDGTRHQGKGPKGTRKSWFRLRNFAAFASFWLGLAHNGAAGNGVVGSHRRRRARQRRRLSSIRPATGSR